MTKLNFLSPDKNNLYAYFYSGISLFSVSILIVFLNSFFSLDLTSFLPGTISYFLPLIIGFIGLHLIRIEYSGIKFALFYLAEYVHLFGISVLGSIIFLGGPNGFFFESNLLIIIKALILFTVVLFVRWSFFRIRIDQLLKFNWNNLIPISFLLLLASCVLKYYMDM